MAQWVQALAVQRRKPRSKCPVHTQKWGMVIPAPVTPEPPGERQADARCLLTRQPPLQTLSQRRRERATEEGV